MFIIDQIAYNSNLREMHPSEKFFFSIATMTMVFISNAPLIASIVFLMMTFLLLYKGRVPFTLLMKLYLLPCAFVLLGMVAIIFSLEVEGGLRLTLAENAFQQGFLLITRSFASISCLYFLVLTTPITEIIYVLEKLRVPILIREMMFFIYRFIFIFIKIAADIHTSQRIRGGYANIKNSYYALSQLISVLFLKAQHHGELTYTALVSRGYTGEIRTVAPPYKKCKKNWIKIAIAEGFLIGIFLWKGQYYG
ncbi:cobalt/nickel transport system permease protein [Natronincola peptidivorans]|uniref:Cobalt/nickel transport system permease protein n=1 Tax=Natronincola peptidivorans TaxID=426128 RepID=A0A1I0CXL7_9FIRM|nr:cobalt ECF transporter T component CbiQ [Natronincola peptidivorans]SET24185.1 cobalt/nickel transport system permease protein [Natronincola peptidivorans]